MNLSYIPDKIASLLRILNMCTFGDHPVVFIQYYITTKHIKYRHF